MTDWTSEVFKPIEDGPKSGDIEIASGIDSRNLQPRVRVHASDGRGSTVMMLLDPVTARRIGTDLISAAAASESDSAQAHLMKEDGATAAEIKEHMPKMATKRHELGFSNDPGDINDHY